MGVILEAVYNLGMLFYYILEAMVVPWIPIKYRSKDVSGQIALVTGAGGGIGRLIAIGLAKLGCKVVCWDIAKQGMHGSLAFELDWIIKIYLCGSQWGDCKTNSDVKWYCLRLPSRFNEAWRNLSIRSTSQEGNRKGKMGEKFF